MVSSRSQGAFVLVAALALAACATDTTTTDAATPTDTGGDADVCASCDDHDYCNGVERCVAGACMPGTSPCMASQTCDEVTDRCLTVCDSTPDADHDGVNAIACGGSDCDDTLAQVHPGAPELCDGANLDEDCDPTTHGERDVDGDGHDDAACCNGTNCGDDCNDRATDVYAGASETCNGRDDDCDTSVDETLSTFDYYPDCDGDGYGDASATAVTACATPTTGPACAGGVWEMTGGDCNDARGGVHPGAAETCNGRDDDCNGSVDDAAVVDAQCQTDNPLARHTTVSCVSGACAHGACNTGFADCNGTLADGCEIDTRVDPAHCGSCTTACGAAALCQASSCEPLAHIDAGAGHTCALYQSGRAVCWGANGSGQLGDGTRTRRTRAVAVAPPLGGSSILFDAIDAGGYRHETDLGITDDSHTCGRTATEFYCWGRGNEGQLGTGTTASYSAPTIVAGLPYMGGLDTGPPYIMAVAAGGTQSYALQRQSRLMPIWSVWAWGAGVTNPASIQSGPEVGYSASAAWQHMCFVDGNSHVQCVGDNTFGQLGVSGGARTSPVVATAIPSTFSAIQVETGGIDGSGLVLTGLQFPESSTCAREYDGTVSCWGSFGTGAVPGIANATDLAVGGRHACVVRSTGRVACWGDNRYGQLGTGTTTNATTPANVAGITTAVDVTAGAEHTCVLLANGTAMCWGRNDSGQLGDGTTNDSLVPVLVLGT